MSLTSSCMGVAQALGLFRGPRLLNLKVKACASSHTGRDRLWRWLGCAAYWSSKSSPCSASAAASLLSGSFRQDS